MAACTSASMQRILDISFRRCRFGLLPFDSLADAHVVRSVEHLLQPFQEKKMSARSTVGIAVILLALALLASPSGADDAKAKPSPEEAAKLFAEASTPGPNHAKLQPLVGSWTYSCKLWMEPGKP